MVSVLLIDDTPARASALASILHETGYEVTAIAEPAQLHDARAADVIVVNARVATRTLFEQLRSMTEHSAKPIVMFNFDAYKALQNELDDTKLKLSERKLVEKAKGILMKSRNLAEDEAYRALRKLAMDKNARLGEVARQVIEVTQLLA